jgi:hypothetical protein
MRIAGRAQEELDAGREARPDDLDPEAVEQRLRIAQSELSPVVDHFGERGELAEIDAMGTPDEICAQVRALVLGVVPQVERPSGRLPSRGERVDEFMSYVVRLLEE